MTLGLAKSEKTLAEHKKEFLESSVHWCTITDYRSEIVSGFTDALFEIMEKECPESAISIMEYFKPKAFLKDTSIKVFSDWLWDITSILRRYPREAFGILKVADFIARGSCKYHAYDWTIKGNLELTFSLRESLIARLELFCGEPHYDRDFRNHGLKEIETGILKILDGLTEPSNGRKTVFISWSSEQQITFFKDILFLLDKILPSRFCERGYKGYYPLLSRMIKMVCSTKMVYAWLLYAEEKYPREEELHELISLAILEKIGPLKALKDLMKPRLLENLE